MKDALSMLKDLAGILILVCGSWILLQVALNATGMVVNLVHALAQ